MHVLWSAGPPGEDQVVARCLERHGHTVTPIERARDGGVDPSAFPLWVVDWSSLARLRAAQALAGAQVELPSLLLLAEEDRVPELGAAVRGGVTEFLVGPLHEAEVEPRLEVLERRIEEGAVRRRLESSLEALIDFSLDPVSVHRDRVLVHVNPAAVKALRFPSAEVVVGRSIYDFLPAEDRDGIERTITAAETTGRRSSLREQRFVCCDGTMLLGEVYSFPASFRGERCVFSVGRDLTQSRRLESQIRHAERLATLGTMTAGIVHELNNPLSFVLANLADLCGQMPGLADATDLHFEGLERRVDAARAGAERLRELTRELTRFASPREEPVGSVDLRMAVSEALHLAGPQLRGVDVSTEWAPIPKVRGTELRLVQVFLNLLINAAQALESKAPDARRVHVRGKTGRQGEAVVEIVDTGVGIPADALAHLFEPFFTTKKPGTGTGLGLVVTRSIVRELGGDIDVESRVGVGTTFRVRLPASDEDQNSMPRWALIPAS